MKTENLGDFTSEEIQIMREKLHNCTKSLNLKPFDTLLLIAQSIVNLYKENELYRNMDPKSFSMYLEHAINKELEK